VNRRERNNLVTGGEEGRRLILGGGEQRFDVGQNVLIEGRNRNKKERGLGGQKPTADNGDYVGTPATGERGSKGTKMKPDTNAAQGNLNL